MSEAFTIMVPTNLVIIERLPREVDCSALAAQGVRVVQWGGTAGLIEYENTPGQSPEDFRPNEPLTSMDAYQSYVDAWHAAAPPPLFPSAQFSWGPTFVEVIGQER